jgi:hypothetical protein
MVEHGVWITIYTLVVLTSYIRALELLPVISYTHMPHLKQQVALDLGRLHTTYVTFFYTHYN